MDDYENSSPMVQELKQELALATSEVVLNCANDVAVLCHGEEDQTITNYILPPPTNIKVPEMGTGKPREEEEEGSFFDIVVFFNKDEGHSRKLTRAANGARRKLFRYIEGDVEEEEKEEHHDHKGHKGHKGRKGEDSHQHRHDHQRPCHGKRGFKLGFGAEDDRCLVDLMISGSPDVSSQCYEAVGTYKQVNEALNEEIAMEEAAEEFAAFLFLLTSLLLTMSILTCVFGRSKFHENRMIRLSILEAVYSDEDIKAAVQSKLPEGMILGDQLPVGRNSASAEPCTCKKVCKAFCSGFMFMFLAIFLLHAFLFFPLLLPVTLIAMTVRACCCKRKRRQQQTDYGLVANDGYPAAAAAAAASGKELELSDKVYVGVPTVA